MAATKADGITVGKNDRWCIMRKQGLTMEYREARPLQRNKQDTSVLVVFNPSIVTRDRKSVV